MSQKSNLLKELGWDEALIKHFMVDDSDLIEHPQQELKTELFDTNTFTINYNTISSGSTVILKIKKRNITGN